MAQQPQSINTGVLFRNKNRMNDKQPTHTGRINVDGIEYRLSAWVKESSIGQKFFSLALTPSEATQPTAGQQPADDEIPF